MLTDLLAGLSPGAELPALGRLFLALLLGAAIGIEREFSGKPAGLRTIMLICAGAELLTEMSVVVASFQLHELVRSDPARIAAQIVSGIGFLGAGTILVHRGSVVGLTTAATLWVAAAIGLTVGAREYLVAVGATVLVLVTLLILGWVERRLIPDREVTIFRVAVRGAEDPLARVEEALRAHGFRFDRLGLERSEAEVRLDYRIRGTRRGREGLLDALAQDDAVSGIHVE